MIEIFLVAVFFASFFLLVKFVDEKIGTKDLTGFPKSIASFFSVSISIVIFAAAIFGLIVTTAFIYGVDLPF